MLLPFPDVPFLGQDNSEDWLLRLRALVWYCVRGTEPVKISSSCSSSSFLLFLLLLPPPVPSAKAAHGAGPSQSPHLLLLLLLPSYISGIQKTAD